MAVYATCTVPGKTPGIAMRQLKINLRVRAAHPSNETQLREIVTPYMSWPRKVF